MLIDFSSIAPRLAYFWMGSTITPRPVAWVSSKGKNGLTNLAPFSFFQMITASPPTLMISPLVNSDGGMKDTVRNIQETGEFVVNLVSFPMVQLMNETSFGYDAETSEFEQCNVKSLPSQFIGVPRVDGAPVSFECRLAKLMPYPEHAPTCYVVFGEVVAAHVDDSIVTADGQIDPVKLDLVSRMGADWYGRTNATENFTLARPAGWAK
ncbi:flavin reductase family protein [Undibacterium sp. RTI2.1]|uniref:flavin reductase family protein n=1 Tax=unclassified Undibacterium TaxID=2630295 RepID=UPI002B22BE51|nr:MULTISPECIES: flavin reductase family protein [unclassified Undibacterium]MEB0032427.1 flavin reductase family protein [Undibacterium sp. RTI2.1]MEB0115892.1 flavin reductase family protein [Undibacterium sp. RTI2.2]